MAPEISSKGAKKAGKSKASRGGEDKKKKEEEEGKLLHLHLQSIEAGPPRYWCL